MSTKALRHLIAVAKNYGATVAVDEALAEVEAIEKACRTLAKEGVEDAVYRVRDRVVGEAGYVGESWEHPRVVAYGEAAQVISNIAKESA